MTALIEHNVPLAPHTTLELGGAAEHFARVRSREQLLEALTWAAKESLPVTVLGGGSNVLVNDRGVSGLVIKLATRGLSITHDDSAGQTVVEAEAGENWDALVERCVTENLSGIECLSGIPGDVGAAPVQNIGAYGQELADCVRSVDVLDLSTLETVMLTASDCQFDYRTSRFKHKPRREIVLALRLSLVPQGAVQVRYPELARALDAFDAGPPTARTVRQAVLQLRRGKSMVLDPQDENRRSVGSFFLNPIVSQELADTVLKRAAAAGLIDDSHDMPRYPQAGGVIKLSAAWLIEHSGTHKGERLGGVGVSSRHCLALVHHGGARTADLIALADTVRARVRAVFGIELVPEPVMLGFDRS